MDGVTLIDYVPQKFLFSGVNEAFCLPCKRVREVFNSWSTEHPDSSVVMYSCQSGNPAVWHREIDRRGPGRGLREGVNGIMPMALYKLSTVIRTQVRGHLNGSLVSDWVNKVRHSGSTSESSHPPMSLNTRWQEMDG